LHPAFLLIGKATKTIRLPFQVVHDFKSFRGLVNRPDPWTRLVGLAIFTGIGFLVNTDLANNHYYFFDLSALLLSENSILEIVGKLGKFLATVHPEVEKSHVAANR